MANADMPVGWVKNGEVFLTVSWKNILIKTVQTELYIRDKISTRKLKI